MKNFLGGFKKGFREGWQTPSPAAKMAVAALKNTTYILLLLWLIKHW